MSATRPLPEYWYPVAWILLVLKALLTATDPGAFGSVAAHAHRQLAYAGAFVRRFLLALARSLDLPPLPTRAPAAPANPAVDWALALHRAELLLVALRRPLPLARRLARRLARGHAPSLRDLPVPWHVLRALPPALDSLRTRLDCLARPDHWSGLDPDTG